MKKTHSFAKSAFRTISANKSRFFSIIGIIFIGVAFVTGIGGISPKVSISFADYLKEAKVPDLIIKYGTEEMEDMDALQGFQDDDIQTVKGYEHVSSSFAFTSLDLTVDEQETRFICYPKETPFNNLDIVEGRWPESDDECLIEQPVDTMTSYKLGDTITVDMSSMASDFTYTATEGTASITTAFRAEEFKFDYEVVGIVHNPVLYIKSPDVSSSQGSLNHEKEEGSYLSIDRILYFDQQAIGKKEFTLDVTVKIGDRSSTISETSLASELIPETDMYLQLNNANPGYFEDSYLKRVESEKGKIEALSETFSSKCSYQTLNDTKAYRAMVETLDKVDIICIVFPFFFIAVVWLVVLTTMHRMIDEERGYLGCYVSLGYSDKEILAKYIIFGIFSSLIGCLTGVLVGMFIIPSIIYPAFDALFYLPAMTSAVYPTYGIYGSIGIILADLIVTIYVALRALKITPANLMRPKAPKPGKKILLERVPFIWNRIKFKTKSSIRNVFRYKGRLAMVILSVAGCTGLIFAGLGIYDVAGSVSSSYLSASIDMSSTLRPIGFAIIVFAMALGLLVIFNLANMNVGERKREIATLEVLGYYNLEVDLYIFREILMMSIIGIIIGIPAGVLFLIFMFNILGFGGIGEVDWFIYLLAAACSLLFVFFVQLLMMPKLRKIDMNESLKSIE